MQKVITVTGLNSFDSRSSDFVELTFTELDKLLKDGYEIKQTIPFKDEQTSYFTVVFILQKD